MIERLLAVLKIVDAERFFYHRSSTVHYHFHEREAAYKDAKASFSLFERPPFAVLSQLIKTEIETNRLPEASEHLSEMDTMFGPTYHDFKLGLHCKYEIANGNFDEALGFIE